MTKRAERSTLSIGKVAKLLDTTTRTVRYYEELGLLCPERDQNGVRKYSEAQVARLLKIKELQNLLGFRLNEIKDLIKIESLIDELKEAYKSSAEKNEQIGILKKALELNGQLISNIEDKFVLMDKFKQEIEFKNMKIKKRLKELKGD
jgi:DNA-binding transcriptional MerR regulator